MHVDKAEQAAVTAGLITTATGVALVAAPRVGGIAGLDVATSRAIGATDLVLVPGLLAGRPRWPWAGARAAANVPTAVALARTGTPLGRITAALLVVLTGLDAASALSLRAARR